MGSTFGVHILVRKGMRASVAGGFALALAGAFALAVVVKLELAIPAAYAALGVMGLGLGPAASSGLIAPQSQVAWDQRGMITSAVYAARMLGGAVVVAALGSVHAAANGSPEVRFEWIVILALAAMVALFVLAPSRLEEAPRESTASRSGSPLIARCSSPNPPSARPRPRPLSLVQGKGEITHFQPRISLSLLLRRKGRGQGPAALLQPVDWRTIV